MNLKSVSQELIPTVPSTLNQGGYLPLTLRNRVVDLYMRKPEEAPHLRMANHGARRDVEVDNNAIMAIAIAIVIILAAVLVWWYSTRKRTEQLRSRFGPEYDRTVDDLGDQRRAESELGAREKRVEALNLRELAPNEVEAYAEEWARVQARFVDDPRTSIVEADRWVGRLMMDRGYPMGDFERRAADISVDHPRVVENYRAAHAIAERSQGGDGNTEELRQAMVHYRSLYTELLGVDERRVRGAA
jgi:hypothetical protein